MCIYIPFLYPSQRLNAEVSELRSTLASMQSSLALREQEKRRLEGERDHAR
jgi:hypothetical protein